MSGVAGADRIKSRQDYQQFIASYKDLVSKFPGFVSIQPSGSYNSNLEKNDFGDIDLITHIKSSKSKKEVKIDLVHFFEKQPDTTIVGFTSEKHAGKRTYNSGEIVTVRYHDHQLGYSAQIDNIIALDHIEAGFKQEFLDMPAEKQGLVLGLVKIAAIETDPKVLFKKLNIHVPINLQSNQEFEFNLSSSALQLRKVTYEPGTFKQTDREVLWQSQKWADLVALLYQYDLSSDFESLLAQSKQNIHNPRSNNRMQGVFSSMISVKSGEVGTAKGANKEAARAKVAQTFGESKGRLLNELVKPKDRTVVMAFGRFQPPTIGHELLIHAVQHAAQAANADSVIYVSRTQDHKNNPLSVDQKIYYLKKMFPTMNFVAADDQVRTPVEAVKHLNNKYNNLIMIAGSDRATSFQEILNKYNGIEFNYHTAKVISSGDRDPDSDSATGMSGTKMREAAVANNLEAFRQGLPHSINEKDAQQLMQAVQQGLVKQPKTKKVQPTESGDIGTPEIRKAGIGFSNYTSVKPKEYESIGEAMLPKSAFAGADKNLINGKGMARGEPGRSQKAPLTGMLVGGQEDDAENKVDEVGGEGTPEGLPHLTKKLLTHIVQQVGDEGAHAIVKSLQWGDGAAKELLQLITKDLKKNISMEESVKQRLDKSCWKGYKKQGTKIKGNTRVNNCVKIGEEYENKIANLIKILESK